MCDSLSTFLFYKLSPFKNAIYPKRQKISPQGLNLFLPQIPIDILGKTIATELPPLQVFQFPLVRQFMYRIHF